MALRALGQATALRAALPRVAVAAALLVGALLAGCASGVDTAKIINPDPPDKMYAAADALMNKGAYSDAARKFEDLDRDHPYAPEARRAIVMAAYAYYKAGKFTEAVASAQRYTTLHPGTKDAALAASHHRHGAFRRHQGAIARSDGHAQGAGGAEGAAAALS